MTLEAPAPLADHHLIDTFDSGLPALDQWLLQRALRNQKANASRTFVACDERTVVGYYALASGSVDAVSVTGRFRRNMPDPIPVVILGRLAVDRAYQGRGLGRALFRDGAARVLHAADAIGVRGILVHAVSEDARAFYLALGFEPSPFEPMTLMVSLTDLRASLGA